MLGSAPDPLTQNLDGAWNLLFLYAFPQGLCRWSSNHVLRNTRFRGEARQLGQQNLLGLQEGDLRTQIDRNYIVIRTGIKYRITHHNKKLPTGEKGNSKNTDIVDRECSHLKVPLGWSTSRSKQNTRERTKPEAPSPARKHRPRLCFSSHVLQVRLAQGFQVSSDKEGQATSTAKGGTG